MKSSQRSTLITLFVFVLILVVLAGFLFNGFEISGKVVHAIDLVKTKYFLYEQEIVGELEHVEHKIEVGAYEFYYGVDKIEQDIIKSIEEFAKSVEIDVEEDNGAHDQAGLEEEIKEGKNLNWDEVCEEVMINLNYCYVNGISVDECGIQIYSQLIEMFDISNAQVLEVEERCLS